MIRVLIVDDQKLMRDGLSAIINASEDIRVVAEGANGHEAVELAGKHRPDIILMYVRMPGMNGVEATKAIKNTLPDIKIIILTTFDDEDYILRGLRDGASGYILKDIEGSKLLESIRSCIRGEVVMPSRVVEVLVNKALNGKSEKQEASGAGDLGFGDREKDVAVMLAQGFTNKQIASALYISEGTVKNYVSSIYSKIDIGDRTKAALFLKERGYI
jgi:DNA-binding NarL/FixJ family response regulator